MPTASSLKGKPQKKSRGNIEELPSGAFRVRVYAGKDPIAGRRYDLKELVPAGPDAQRQAQRILNKFLHQIDERRHPKTNATVNQLLDRYLDQLNVERSTKSTYVVCVNQHIRPLLGTVKAGRVDVEIIDSLHAELRRCRDHCRGKGMVDHRTPLRHECDDRCRPHRCKPLAPSSVLKVHQILSGAFSKAIRWGWITINPMEGASAPSPGVSNPQPPSAEEAAALLNRAWRNDPDWGTFVWLAMVMGSRRGEICAIRWRHLDLESRVLHLEKAIAQDGSEIWEDTKSHRDRRIVLDEGTVALLTEHWERVQQRAPWSCRSRGTRSCSPSSRVAFGGRPACRGQSGRADAVGAGGGRCCPAGAAGSACTV